MSEISRPWTAQILVTGTTAYAWVAYNSKFETFATEHLDHCRRFDSKEDVEAWIERLNVPNATPYKIGSKVKEQPVEHTPPPILRTKGSIRRHCRK